MKPLGNSVRSDKAAATQAFDQGKQRLVNSSNGHVSTNRMVGVHGHFSNCNKQSPKTK